MNKREVPELSAGLRDLLQKGSWEDESGPEFEEKILREVRLSRSAKSLRFWAPIIAGAAATGIAISALVQVLTAPDRDAEPLRGQEARRMVTTELPDLSERSLMR